jgi:hypothetical protein
MINYFCYFCLVFYHSNEFVYILLADTVRCLRAKTARCGKNPQLRTAKTHISEYVVFQAAAAGYVPRRVISARKQRGCGFKNRGPLELL